MLPSSTILPRLLNFAQRPAHQIPYTTSPLRLVFENQLAATTVSLTPLERPENLALMGGILTPEAVLSRSAAGLVFSEASSSQPVHRRDLRSFNRLRPESNSPKPLFFKLPAALLASASSMFFLITIVHKLIFPAPLADSPPGTAECLSPTDFRDRIRRTGASERIRPLLLAGSAFLGREWAGRPRQSA